MNFPVQTLLTHLDFNQSCFENFKKKKLLLGIKTILGQWEHKSQLLKKAKIEEKGYLKEEKQGNLGSCPYVIF